MEPKLGGFAIAEGIFTGAAQVPNGFILNRGDVDRGQVPRAHQAGQLDRVPTGGFDPIAGLLGDQRWGHHPADVAFLREIAGAPIPAGPRFRDKDQICAFGLHFPDELVDIALARTDGAEGDNLGVVFLSNIGNGNRIFMDIHADVERARLWHG